MKAFLYKCAEWLTVPVERTSSLINWAGCFVLAVMMFFTAADVMGRYFFNRPILGSFEIQAFLMAIVVGFSLAICGVNKGHISVDIVLSLLPKRVRAVMDLISDLVSISFMVFVTWQTFHYMVILYQTHNVASTIPIPSWPFALASALGMTVFSLVLLRDCCYIGYQSLGGHLSLSGRSLE